MSNTPEFVRVRECPDGSHPEGDGVFIHPKATLDIGLAARQDMFTVFGDAALKTEAEKDRALLRRWFDTYCRMAPVSWNLHDPEVVDEPLHVERPHVAFGVVEVP